MKLFKNTVTETIKTVLVVCVFFLSVFFSLPIHESQDSRGKGTLRAATKMLAE